MIATSLPRPADRPIVTIDLAALRRNWRAVASVYSGRFLGAVVKNDAYGLGADRIVPLLAELGCRHFWVDTFDAALAVRKAVAPGTVYVLHGLAGVDTRLCREHDIVPVLVSGGEVQRARADARLHGPLKVAVHLDTGLSRVGLDHTEVGAIAADPSALQGLDVQAWVTQLGRFADPGATENIEQRMRLMAWAARLPRAPLSLATSSCVFADTSWHLDHARVGSALYGVDTTPSMPQDVVPVATLSAPVLRVTTLPTGTEIGYAGTFRTTAPTTVATLAIGYGDGLPFSLAHHGQVLLDGLLAPIVGGISMGMISVDITRFTPGQVQPGMHATLFGADLRLEQVAAAAGVAPNALLVASAAHASRYYVDDEPRSQAPGSTR